MLPKTTEDIVSFTIVKQPSLTYKMSIEKEKLEGKTDKIEAVKQAVYKILETERYQNLIYSWNYGIELKDLFGRSYLYVCSELPRRMTEALTQDDRIKQVDGFRFARQKGAVSVTFTVHTTQGAFTVTKEVRI